MSVKDAVQIVQQLVGRATRMEGQSSAKAPVPDPVYESVTVASKATVARRARSNHRPHPTSVFAAAGGQHRAELQLPADCDVS